MPVLTRSQAKKLNIAIPVDIINNDLKKNNYRNVGRFNNFIEYSKFMDKMKQYLNVFNGKINNKKMFEEMYNFIIDKLPIIIEICKNEKNYTLMYKFIELCKAAYHKLYRFLYISYETNINDYLSSVIIFIDKFETEIIPRVNKNSYKTKIEIINKSNM